MKKLFTFYLCEIKALGGEEAGAAEHSISYLSWGLWWYPDLFSLLLSKPPFHFNSSSELTMPILSYLTYSTR
jgi:hypothetical protein